VAGPGRGPGRGMKRGCPGGWVVGWSSTWMIEVFVFNLEVCHISNLLIVFQISVEYESKR